LLFLLIFLLFKIKTRIKHLNNTLLYINMRYYFTPKRVSTKGSYVVKEEEEDFTYKNDNLIVIL